MKLSIKGTSKSKIKNTVPFVCVENTGVAKWQRLFSENMLLITMKL
jgi:hypothetical protein